MGQARSFALSQRGVLRQCIQCTAQLFNVQKGIFVD